MFNNIILFKLYYYLIQIFKTSNLKIAILVIINEISKTSNSEVYFRLIYRKVFLLYRYIYIHIFSPLKYTKKYNKNINNIIK